MNVVVTCPQHFERTPDGRVWTKGQFPHPFWLRYRSVFDAVRVVARVRDVDPLLPGREPASGEGVAFVGVPDYLGPQQFLLRLPRVLAAISHAAQHGDAMILRAPGELDARLRRRFCNTGRPYGVEVVSDPYDVFAPKAVKHPLRPLFRWWFTRALRRECASACAAAFVTEHALQKRYPPAPHAFTTHYSSIDLPREAFLSAPRSAPPNGFARLVFVGTLAQYYKAPDVLLDSFASCVREGMNLELVMIGSGKYQGELQSRISGMGLSDRLYFRGQLTQPEVLRSELDRADLFVLPSRQEGLPRAMIEAMARALPCIGSTVGGIPELLPAEDMVPPDNSAALADKIREVLADPIRMLRMSARNLGIAQSYAREVLNRRRQVFYQHVRDRTEAWLNEEEIE